MLGGGIPVGHSGDVVAKTRRARRASPVPALAAASAHSAGIRFGAAKNWEKRSRTIRPACSRIWTRLWCQYMFANSKLLIALSALNAAGENPAI